MCGKYVVANMSFVQTVRLFFSVRSAVVMTLRRLCDRADHS